MMGLTGRLSNLPEALVNLLFILSGPGQMTKRKASRGNG
jgi:hypothetical protein